ncbi:hypothetical protein BVY02_01325 [bacterium J17]|nr:hypothetical protein BVY02_01325 [bacterium J17]
MLIIISQISCTVLLFVVFELRAIECTTKKLLAFFFVPNLLFGVSAALAIETFLSILFYPCTDSCDLGPELNILVAEALNSEFFFYSVLANLVFGGLFAVFLWSSNSQAPE